MGKLFETFNQIEGGRRKCIDNLNAMNVFTPEDANFDIIANNITSVVNGVDLEKKQRLWKRPSEWIDTEQLLLNAPELVGFTPFAVYLIHDNRPTITLTITPLGTSTSNAYSTYIRNAYYLSDGTIYSAENGVTTNVNVTHTWDTTKDIKTSLHYNLRYLIAYIQNEKINVNGSSLGSNTDYDIGDSLLELVFKNPYETNKTIYIPHCSYNTAKLNLQRIHILDCNFSFPNNNSDYNSIKEIRIDKSGELSLSGYGIFSSAVGSNYMTSGINLILPNVVSLYVSYGNSSIYTKCNYIYIPNVEIIRGSTGSANYADMYATYIYAPKLSQLSNRKITLNAKTIDNIPLLTTSSNLSMNSIEYLDTFFYRLNTAEAELDKQNGVYLYNPIISKLTNTTAFSEIIVRFDLPNLIEVNNPEMFNNAAANWITDFNIGDGFKSSLNISQLKYISSINLLDILYKLADVTGEEEIYTLTLGTSLLSMLSDEEKAIATNKGWVLA